MEVAYGNMNKTTPSPTHLRNQDSLLGENNNASLFHLNDPAVLHHLKARFEERKIYTFYGEMLIKVNPMTRKGGRNGVIHC